MALPDVWEVWQQLIFFFLGTLTIVYGIYFVGTILIPKLKR